MVTLGQIVLLVEHRINTQQTKQEQTKLTNEPTDRSTDSVPVEDTGDGDYIISLRTFVIVTGKLKSPTKEVGAPVGTETVKETPYCPDLMTKAEAPTNDGVEAKLGDAVTTAEGKT